MRSLGIVIGNPRGDGAAGMVDAEEQALVEQLVAHSPVETLDEGILLRLAGLDIVPVDAADLAPFEDRHAGEFGAVVGDACSRLGSPPRNHGVQLAANAVAR